MDLRPDSSLLQNFPIDSLIAYLNLTGWRRVAVNKRWFVFEGSKDIHDDALEVVLPRLPDASDLNLYIANAVNLLSALSNESPEVTVRRVRHYDSDVLTVRNLETGERDSITLRLAQRQVSRLKQLVAYSACSEREPKPYFIVQSGIADRMVEHYRFGHTFAGSFGYTIESALIHESDVFRSEFQDRLFELEAYTDEDVVVTPLERRVMERLVRGLRYTEQARSEHSIRPLMQEYGSGLNSNMCLALVGLAEERSRSVEYTVLWSPKLPAPEDIRFPESVRLMEESYHLLLEAAEELKTVKPEYVTLRGVVTELSSSGDPLGDSTATRSVAIRWMNRPNEARPIKVVVSLSKEDYVAANRAHLTWRTVEVTGIIERAGSIWRLLEPTDFSVLG